MWLNKIIYRKYHLNGYNNPTDFFYGIKEQLPKREKGITRIYFAGLPEHGNMGDQAIALAMVKYIEQFSKKYEILTFSMSRFLDSLLPIRKDLKKGDIFFLIGGGNMGVEYFGNEEVRRLIIEMFPNNRIIIFPQTIDYGNSELGKNELAEAARIYGKHKNLHIFAREEVSYHIMKEHFYKNHVYLTPDIVYSLKYKKTKERDEILFCIRKDRESALSSERINYLERILSAFGTLRKMDTVESYVPVITSEKIREILVYRKLDEFASARFVITDRLHGMIFSVITNTPCIVLGNYNHKLYSSYQTWLSDFPNIYYLENVDELGQVLANIKEEDNSEELYYLRKEYTPLERLLS